MNAPRRTAIISTVGTSIFTHGAGKDLAMLLRDTANLRTHEYSAGDLQNVSPHLARVNTLMETESDGQIRRLSAELNGIFAINFDSLEPHCLHYLLHTDTLQGAEAARQVCSWLQRRGCTQSITCRLAHLSTRNQECFSKGIDSLLEWCETTLPDLRRQGYHIAFNLVGGFKTLQAYTQTIGMVYADEITYLFEAPGSHPIRIPRLPISFDTVALDKHASIIARMAEAHEIVSAGSIADIPEVYLDCDGEHAALSTWGKLAWNQRKELLLRDQLIPQPGLRYGEGFMRDFEACRSRDQRVALQLTLAKVASLWADGGLRKLRSDGGLQYADLSGGIGHFRVNLGDRVTCVPEGDTLVLRRFGTHDIIKTP